MADNHFREVKKLMPVPCGCGGEAKAWEFMNGKWYVKCHKCAIGQMFAYRTEKEAVEAWNAAMLGNMKKAFLEVKYECFDCKYFDCGICKAEPLDDFYATPGNRCQMWEMK